MLQIIETNNHLASWSILGENLLYLVKDKKEDKILYDSSYPHVYCYDEEYKFILWALNILINEDRIPLKDALHLKLAIRKSQNSF